MSYLDDLPKRHPSHDIGEKAVAVFKKAIIDGKYFNIQSEDINDYGTDIQIEAQRNEMMTNVRIHVQLKGTTSDALQDNSVSISIDRTNLNYLLSQEDSIYVCWHCKSERLLVRFASDVYREYSEKDPSWRNQKTITVNFSKLFDEEFQKSLCESADIRNRRNRDQRLRFSVTPPRKIVTKLYNDIPYLKIPGEKEKAAELLNRLYEKGEDEVISYYFESFEAVLGESSIFMTYGYLAEVNIGICALPFKEERIHRAIELIKDKLGESDVFRGQLLYNLGNARFVLKEYESARITYIVDLSLLDSDTETAAQCFKNCGAVLLAEGKYETAKIFFEKALELVPDLPQANLSMGLWHKDFSKDFSKVIYYLDRISSRKMSKTFNSVVYAWRAEAFFNVGDFENAFRDINSLLRDSDKNDWVWPWCASLVSRFWTASIEAIKKSLNFWLDYLEEFPDDLQALYEKMSCVYSLIIDDPDYHLGLMDFEKLVNELVDKGHPSAAYLWDRVGHVAQNEGNWNMAERYYRRAYDFEKDKYSYCLGTALNFLGKFEESLPITLEHANGPNSDEMSWFQVAIAREGVGNLTGAINAYEKAIAINPEYSLAWFNLGGIYNNVGDHKKAKKVWKEAIRKFPNHKLIKDVQHLIGS